MPEGAEGEEFQTDGYKTIFKAAGNKSQSPQNTVNPFLSGV